MKFYSSEKFESIASELSQRRWEQVAEDDGLCQLIWTNLKSINFDSIGADTIVNHMKGSQHLSNKALFAYHMHTSRLGLGILPANWSSAFHDLGQLVSLLFASSVYCLAKTVLLSLSLPTELIGNIAQYKELLRHCIADKELSKSTEIQTCCSLLSVLNANHVDKAKLKVEVEKIESSERWRKRWGGVSNVFIVKPVGLSCGENIEVTQGLYQTLKCVEKFEYKCVVQKYIERPLLVRDNRKFDIRQWILVTSADPLVVFGYSECYLRLSSEEYSLDKTKLDAAQVHLCNHAIQKFHNKESTSEGEVAESVDGQMYDTMMTQNEFNEELLRKNVPEWKESRTPFHSFIQPKIRNACVAAVQSCRDRLQRVGKGFEWLGVDLMVSLHSSKEEYADEGTASATAGSDVVDVLLLEVNVSPDISLSTPVTTRLVNLAIPDLFTLLLDESVMDATTFPGDYHRRIAEVDKTEAREPRWELWYQASDDKEDGRKPMTVLQFAHAKRSVEVLHPGDYRPRKLELFQSVMNTLAKGGSGANNSQSSIIEDEDEDEI